MKESLLSVFAVIFLLSLGYFFGNRIKASYRQACLSCLSGIVMLLLFVMGVEFGQVFINKETSVDIVINALLLSGLISLITFLLLIKRNSVVERGKGFASFFAPFYGCAKAGGSFCLGLLVYPYIHTKLAASHISSHYLLYLLIFLVGMDLVNFKLSSINRRLLALPALTLAGTLIAVLIFAQVRPYSFVESMVVASGFGWFSLSGPMVKSLVSPEMGAMAFMTDFFREMFSIIFLYFLGKRQPQSAIGISGAAALDLALPFIKQNCHEEYIKHAIISGFVLSLLAPLFIAFSVSLL